MNYLNTKYFDNAKFFWSCSVVDGEDGCPICPLSDGFFLSFFLSSLIFLFSLPLLCVTMKIQMMITNNNNL